MADAVTASRSLDQWLAYIEQVHAVGIDMGLERVTAVAERLALQTPDAHVITVAGTNGKGSTAIAMEQLLLGTGMPPGRCVGTTLSPHLDHFNERIRIQGQAVEDALICAAFAAIEDARGEIPLTYFEFATLAALWCFRARGVTVMILEIGLGGRLDAFNLVSAHTAIITSIGLDHQRYLGTDLAAIGAEKAGIFRAGQRLCLGPDMPDSVHTKAAEFGLQPLQVDSAVQITETAHSWSLAVCEGTTQWHISGLPNNAFNVSNCALALTAVWPLLTPAQRQARRLRDWSAALVLAGRCQQRTGSGRHWLLDVGHNPLAARHLLSFLRSRMPERRVVAVFGVLEDKPAAEMAQLLAARVSHWVLVPTRGARGQTSAALAARLTAGGAALENVHQASSVAQGLRLARSLTAPCDEILVWGSFDVVQQANGQLAP